MKTWSFEAAAMKFSYKFSSLLGTVYRKGNVVFTADGNTLISPVGNRISFYDLKNNKSETLSVESRYNYTSIDLSPNGCLLLAVNEEGEAHLISLVSRTIVHKYRFNRAINCVRFSPDGKHFAVTKENGVFVYKTPGYHEREFNPFEMERVFQGAFDETVHIEWSFDSRILSVASKDTSTRLYALERFENFGTYSIGSHTDSMVCSHFEADDYDLYTVGRNGQVCVWECSLNPDDMKLAGSRVKKRQDKEDEEDDIPDKEEEKKEVEEAKKQNKYLYRRIARHYLLDSFKAEGKSDVTLTSSAYHKKTRIMVSGFSNGAFFIHEMPDMNLIHSLSVSDHLISTVALNLTGDWIALGSVTLGQLLVWEWQSETYVLKQQGHYDAMTCVAYSPDGQCLATGGRDGKVKLWKTSTGFCFVTFTDHTSGISAVQFSHSGKVVVSAGLDGTVRAFDMGRYRNFRTFASPRPTQFTSLSVDHSGDLVAASSQDSFEVYLWSVRTGRLLEVLSGHEAPVASLSFSPSPTSSSLVSVSWDKTLRIWDAVDGSASRESVTLSGDGLCVCYRPDGLEIAVATLDGHITMFDTKTRDETHSIEGRNDLGSGRSDTDLVSAKKTLQGKAFTTLCYTADGNFILAGGQSKNVCIYSIKEATLVRKFEITQNRSMDAVDDFLRRKVMSEFGNLDLVEARAEGEAAEAGISLPGVRAGDMAARKFKPEVRVHCLRFSPTGHAWAAATTEGLLIYSLDHNLLFDPYQLEIGITPDTIKKTLREGDFGKALMMSLKLNELKVIQQVLESIPVKNIELVSRLLPEYHVERLLSHLGTELESTRHLEFYLIWAQTLLVQHSHWLKRKSISIMPTLHTLQKSLTRKQDDLSAICDHNKYLMRYLTVMGENRAKREAPKDDEEEEGAEEHLMEVDHSD